MPLRVILFCMALLSPVEAQTTSDPATPEIILPSHQKDKGASDSNGDMLDSTTLANKPMPLEMDRLSMSLSGDLVAYFPMTSNKMGCLAWSSKPIHVTATKEVAIKQAGGKSFADFSTPGAKLIIDPPLKLGTSFTLMAWVQTPSPKDHGNVWHGSGLGGCYLFIEGSTVSAWKETTKMPFAMTKSPLEGWYHIAVTYDGRETQCFLNGNPLDSLKGNMAETGDLAFIGSGSRSEFDDRAMAAGIADQYIFDRCLSVDEIKEMMNFNKPSKEFIATAPSSETSTSAAPSTTSGSNTALTPDEIILQSHPFGK